MRRVIFRLLYIIFPRYLINSTIFGKRLLNIKCVLIFSTNLSETFLILRRIQRDVTINNHWLSNRYCCRILTKLEFSLDRVLSNIQIRNFMKIRPVGAELFHAERGTDMTKLIVAFLNFTTHPLNIIKKLIFVVPCIMLNSEINPARCNNCVYSSQWLYSTCFG